ncbi:MAG: carbamate kinase [Thermoproteota archaeon]|jgi:carbamate kinase|nr:carbamate kinase [Thermoproteota archaeon]
MEKIVIAIGGNAIEEVSALYKVCAQIALLHERGFKLVLTHGNGPQIGELLLMHEAVKNKESLDTLVAMTQAQIGYKIQQALQYYLKSNDKIYVIITRVLVDRKDEAFLNPTKPIGPLYDEEEALKLINQGYTLKKVTMGDKIGYRRVVPSPRPISILEINAIKKLSEEGIVISCGGGGIPVVINEKGYIEGIEAVIDKDLTSSLLASELKYDKLLIATNIEKVKLNFMKENEKSIDEMSLEEAKKYLDEGHFLEGSMKPKIIACIKFLENGGKQAIITSTDKILEAIYGNAGTKITK